VPDQELQLFIADLNSGIDVFVSKENDKRTTVVDQNQFARGAREA